MSATNKAQALAAKDRGNAAFTAKKYDEAVQEFTKAIQLDPTDHVFYSNRSGAFASLNKWDEALKDADEALKLKPDFVKGYSRRGVALYNLRRYPEAKSAYEQGLKHDPKSEQMKEGLEQAAKAAEAPPKDSSNNPFAKMFGPQMWTKLMMDPVTKNYLNDQSYVNKMKMIQANPQLLQGMMQGDNRIQQSLGVLLGLGAQFGEGGEGPQQQGGPGGFNTGPTDAEEAEEIQAKPKEKEQEAENEKPAENKKPKAKEPEPTKSDADMAPEDRERVEKRKRADDEKDKGNDLYKKRKFDEAVSHYNKALEIDNTNAAYLSNVAAALFEQKKYEESLDACKRAEKIANENKTSFDIRAKIFGRMGHAYMALKKYGDALSAFDRSLLEEGNDKIRDAQRKARDMKKKEDDVAYLDPVKASEAKNRGNELFKTGKWVDAITEYSEAIRRDPNNAALYSNRAACYQKIMEWGRALEDCEKCLQLDPKFVKAYIRLGKVQHFLKQYHKAVETYEKGLVLDAKNEELLEGLRDTQRVIAAEHVSGKVDPKRAQEAMKDPEIQAILRDPTINKVLGDLKNDPSSAQAALRDPTIQAKLNKLIAAGILGRGKPGEDETGG